MYTSKHILALAAATATAAMALTGCLSNDLPYPKIQPNFTAFMVEGMSATAQIDTVRRTITLPLGEEVDITSVKVLSYNITPTDASFVEALPQTLNLTNPYVTTLQLYQEYDWTITATQTIERLMTISGQIGAAEIDVPARRVVAYIPTTADLGAVKVDSIKLGSTAAVMSPNLNGQTVDFTSPVEVTVTDYGRSATWTIYVEQTDASVTLTQADAWTKVAWLYGSAEAGKDNGFEYRVAGTENWSKVPSSWVTTNGGTFTARVINLTPETTYEVRAYSDLDVTTAQTITTGEAPQLPNADFELWWMNGKVYCPWAEDGTRYWDTGNRGSSTMNKNVTFPSPDTRTGTGYCAELQSQFVGIASVGKFAAGSIFIGEYVRTDGTNGVLSFGREFTQRPTGLSGYFRYTDAPITSVGSEAAFADFKGRPDTAIVWMALIDSPEPFEVRTKLSDRQLFDSKGSYVVAYGAMEVDHTVADWTHFNVQLNYVATNRTPRYLLVTASASKWGDYFVGADGATLLLDDFQLEYDY